MCPASIEPSRALNYRLGLLGTCAEKNGDRDSASLRDLEWIDRCQASDVGTRVSNTNPQVHVSVVRESLRARCIKQASYPLTTNSAHRIRPQ